MNRGIDRSTRDLILNNIGRFIDLTPEEKDLFISFLTVKQIKKRDFLIKPGDIARYEYFVTKGCLKVYTIDDKGSEYISMFAVESWWTGDLASFATGEPGNYFIQALEDSEVLRISKDNFNLLFERIPKFERFYRILYQKSLITYIQRANYGISQSAEERYLLFAKKYPGLLNRISQKNLAAYLGVTPEFLSVLRKKLIEK